MAPYDEEITNLLQLYLSQGLTEQQKHLLEKRLQENPAYWQLFEEICQESAIGNNFARFENINDKKAWKKISRKLHFQPTLPIGSLRIRIGRIAAVVIPFLLLVGGLIHDYHSQSHLPDFTEINTGKAQATLRLSNQKAITLNEHSSYNVQVAHGIYAVNDSCGIVYPEQTTKSETEENILEVSRGGEYKVTLSDGTEVFLNSGSQLRYPVTFKGDRREVYLTGEGYFQVAQDSIRPFYVHVNDLSIRVYGTAFNINTHEKGYVQTVLVEGKIKIRIPHSAGEYQILPGQLAVYDLLKQNIDIQNTNIYPYIAWKNREFAFENKSLESIMENLNLWYDTEVFFQNPALKEIHFTGNLGRYENISTILNAISEVTPVKFNIKGKTIIVKE